MKIQIWEHAETGERYAVIFEDGFITSASSALTQEEVERTIAEGRVGEYDHENDKSVAWELNETPGDYRCTWTSNELVSE